MTARIKVLHIISSLMSGGAEAMLSKVARASAKLDIDHHVVAMMNGGPIAAELTNAGIPVHFLGADRNVADIRHIPALRRLVRTLQPDLIQGWMYHGDLAATAACRFIGRQPLPVVWNVRQTVPSLTNEKFFTIVAILAGALFSRTPRAIVYNSLRGAEDHERFGYSRKRRIIIPNGFDTELFRPNPNTRRALLDELRLPSDALIVGRVANFHLHKDFPTLTAAFARISQKNQSAHLMLIGRGYGANNKEFMRLMASLPFPDRVHVMGERSDVAHIMPGFDVLLSSSSAEAFPNVIGEAMACGVPAVTTDAGDCAAILNDPARVAGCRDAGMLAEKTLAILALDPVERAKIGERDRAAVIERYSIAVISRLYVDLWRKSICAG